MRDSQGFHLDQPGDKDIRLFPTRRLILGSEAPLGKGAEVGVCVCVCVCRGVCVCVYVCVCV